MVTTAKPVPRSRRRAETRQRLMDAALGVFARNGYERATVDEIVREAGFSKGAFYVHFEAKEDIFWAMLEERTKHLQEAFREAADLDLPVSQNLAMILRSIFSQNRDDPLWSALFMEFAAHASRNHKVRDQLATLHRSWRDFAMEALDRGRDAGLVRKDLDVEFASSVQIAVVEGMLMQSRLAPDTFDLDSTVEPLSRLLGEWLEP
jgi:TetR/AcrR family transcriptional regulator, transcriptional repressor for nem operon